MERGESKQKKKEKKKEEKKTKTEIDGDQRNINKKKKIILPQSQREGQEGRKDNRRGHSDTRGGKNDLNKGVKRAKNKNFPHWHPSPPRAKGWRERGKKTRKARLKKTVSRGKNQEGEEG